MTQPEKPDSSRGTRPQLFGAPSERKPRQPDFGPSILATIDGVPRRDKRSREGLSLKRVLLMAAMALAATAVYFGLKLHAANSASVTEAPVVQSREASPVSLALAKPAEPTPVVAVPVVAPVAAPVAASAASAGAGAAGEGGAAAIETIAAPSRPASATDSAPNVAASLSNIQQVLARSGPKNDETQARRTETKVAQKDHTKPKEAPAAAPVAKAGAKAGKDSDADLLAAMLPHIKRSAPVPTSPAYDKRCGSVSGDAALDCRARFCAGREGGDAACPVPGGR